MSRDMHSTRGTRIHPKGLRLPFEGDLPHRDTGANKGSICRYDMLDSFLKVSPLRARQRGPFNQVRDRGFLGPSSVRSSKKFG
jgi:hypothetical protein